MLHTYGLLARSQCGRTAREYCTESTPSTTAELLLSLLAPPLAVLVLAPCADDELIGRCSDVGTTTVSSPDDRFSSSVLYSALHLSINS